MNLKSKISAFKGKGIRYVIFRSFYELRRKIGLMRLSYPTSYVEKHFISLDGFRKEDYFFFASRESLSIPKAPSDALKEKAERILKSVT